MNPSPAPRKVSSLAEVNAFVMECNAARFDDTGTPWEQSPRRCQINADDISAEAKSEGRLIEKRRANPHD